MADERVDFTRGAADRIARTVRLVEQGQRDQSGPRYGKLLDDPSSGGVLRLGTFTGTWAVGTLKTVTMHGSTNTANVQNWCVDVGHADASDTANTTKTRYVIFGTIKGTHSAVEIQMQTTSQTCALSMGGVDLTSLAGYDENAIQLLGHSSNGPCLQWYSITTCSTATAS